MGIKGFDIRNNTLIVSNREVTAMDIRAYLQKRVKGRMFPRGTQFRIYGGSHGSHDGVIADPDQVIFMQLKQQLKKICEQEETIIDEMEYGGLSGSDLRHISKSGDSLESECKRHLKDFFRDLIKRDEHYVLILAFCYTDRNEFTNYMYEFGVVAVAGIKNDFGNITKGNCFMMDKGQLDIIKRVAKYHEFIGNHDREGIAVFALLDRELLDVKDPVEVKARLSEHENNCQSCQSYQTYHAISRGAFNVLYEEWNDQVKNLRQRFDSRGRPKNILLAGSSGTGKTILLAEAMSMRIGYYTRKGEPLRIIIAVWNEKARTLSETLIDKYFPHLKKYIIMGNKHLSSLKSSACDSIWDVDGKTRVEFYGSRLSLLKKFGINESAQKQSQTKIDELNNVFSAMEKVSIISDEASVTSRRTLLFIDEFELEVTKQGKQDFSSLSSNERVDFFIAISPWAEGGFKFVPPVNPQIFGMQLKNRHRNCLEIHNLNMHFIGDTGVNNENDEIDEDALPKGKIPLLIVKKKEDTYNDILTFIGDYDGGDYIEGQGVTVLGRRNYEIDAWCNKNDHRKYVKEYTFTGCEDDVIILFCNAFEEEVTRARSRLIIVIEPGSLK